jgi:glycosyltransferase involved in cell wall biosynthesis
MKVAIDISPLSDSRTLSHRVRGVGFYLQNLKDSLIKYHPENKYVFFEKRSQIPSGTQIVHYPYFEPFFRTLPVLKKYKTVVTVHDLTPLVFPGHFPSGLKGSINWQIQKFNLQRADRIITDSEKSKKDIIRYAGIPDNKIDVVYLAAGKAFASIKNEVLSIKVRKKYKLPPKFVLYVGDATWNKNLPRLVRAISKIKVPLVMVGKTLTETEYDKQNPWNKDLTMTQDLISNNPNATALGFVPTEDLAALYNTATCFVMPSLYEGFGLPILEAMQSSCPVITTREGSIPEVAGDAALYVEAEDEDSVADGIKKVWDNDKLQKELSEKGLTQAARFSWKKTAAQTIKAYEKVLRS